MIPLQPTFRFSGGVESMAFLPEALPKVSSCLSFPLQSLWREKSLQRHSEILASWGFLVHNEFRTIIFVPCRSVLGELAGHLLNR